MKDVFIDGHALETKLGIKCSAIERTLGLPQRSLKDNKFLELPETQAVLKIIYSMPWVLEIAENNFDQETAQLILQREAVNIKINERKLQGQQNG